MSKEQINDRSGGFFRPPLSAIPVLFRPAALTLLALSASWLLWVASYAFWPGPSGEARTGAPGETGRDVAVSIPPRTTLTGIKNILVRQGVIKNDKRFALLARLMGTTQRLQAGDYVFRTPQTPYSVMNTLKRGGVVQLTVTIPEGDNMYDIADNLAARAGINRQRFLELVRDPLFIKDLDLDMDSLEGYLFPDTYNVTRGQDPRSVIRSMVKRLFTVLSEFDELKDGKGSMTRHEVLTLASIVEKETASPSERPLIAKVFLGRLQRGMRLQADPTVIYGIEKFNGNLTRRDLKTPSPYNTYCLRGLPVGPIGNPGRDSIAAVLHPAKESYLYFVSKNDGTHHFSKTLAEHNRAVYIYQKRGKNRRR